MTDSIQWLWVGRAKGYSAHRAQPCWATHTLGREARKAHETEDAPRSSSPRLIGWADDRFWPKSFHSTQNFSVCVCLYSKRSDQMRFVIARQQPTHILALLAPRPPAVDLSHCIFCFDLSLRILHGETLTALFLACEPFRCIL